MFQSRTLRRVEPRTRVRPPPVLDIVRTDAPFVALDFETADQGPDSACAIGVVRIEHSVIVARASRLIRPPRRDVVFSYIHGLTWPKLSTQPRFADVWPEVAPLFADIHFIAAHNASFDKGVLQACCIQAQLSHPTVPYACTVRLARAVWNIRPTRLPDVCRHLGIDLRHHDAASDAEACANIVIRAHAELGIPR